MSQKLILFKEIFQLKQIIPDSVKIKLWLQNKDDFQGTERGFVNVSKKINPLFPTPGKEGREGRWGSKGEAGAGREYT